MGQPRPVPGRRDRGLPPPGALHPLPDRQAVLPGPAARAPPALPLPDRAAVALHLFHAAAQPRACQHRAHRWLPPPVPRLRGHPHQETALALSSSTPPAPPLLIL